MQGFRRLLVCMLVVFIAKPFHLALATAAKVHLTGPACELPQYVGRSFTIGVTATNFDSGEVTITGPTNTQTLTMQRKRRNYFTYTPIESGTHTIAAMVRVAGVDRVWKSEISIVVYPVEASERAAWMVNIALQSVGREDAATFVAKTGLSEDDDWCAAFIGWCSKYVHIPRSAGLEALFAGVDLYTNANETISCKTCAGNHKARFLGKVLTAEEQPAPGDLVFFIWGSKIRAQTTAHPGYQMQWHGNASHVGIVTAVNGDTFSFVHGNVPMGKGAHGVAINQSNDEKEGKTYVDWVVAFMHPLYDTPLAENTP